MGARQVPRRTRTPRCAGPWSRRGGVDARPCRVGREHCGSRGCILPCAGMAGRPEGAPYASTDSPREVDGDVHDLPLSPIHRRRHPRPLRRPRRGRPSTCRSCSRPIPFLDMAGEDLRRRIFLTESETGAALCLRPEFTIPVCLDHIASRRPARRAAIPISARCSASAARAATSSSRPASRISATATRRAPTRGRWPMPMRC